MIKRVANVSDDFISDSENPEHLVNCSWLPELLNGFESNQRGRLSKVQEKVMATATNINISQCCCEQLDQLIICFPKTD